MRALSVRQPWAHFITQGIKRIENRSWTTTYRGWMAIHASTGRDVGVTPYPTPKQLPQGRFVAIVRLVAIIDERENAMEWPECDDDWMADNTAYEDSDEEWCGDDCFHWVLRDVIPLEEDHQALHCAGKLRLWTPPKKALFQMAVKVPASEMESCFAE